MDLKNQTGLVKPVAWKPSPARFQSFSALLNSTIDIDDHHHHYDAPPWPPVANDQKLVVTAAIRPKTVRLKPAASSLVRNQDPTFMNSLKVKLQEASPSPAPELYSSTSMNVIHKPVAKVVTKNSHPIPHTNFKGQQKIDDQDLDQQALTKLHSTKSESAGTLTFGESCSLYETDKANGKRMDALKIIEQNKSFPPWFDGYTWRKYGQKQVKGSEYPRSYYRCTHPNCPVKKMIERSLSGKIEEVVYKGEHNHPKTRPAKRNLGLGGLDQIRRELQGECSGYESNFCYENNIDIEPKPKKKRKSESTQLSDPGSGEVVENDKVTIPYIMSVESEIAGDTFRWRKYGQKAVKGNPNPRSYYRCTNPKCTARKYIEKSSDDSNALITTYEGKHNHDVPNLSKTKLLPNL